MNFSIAEARSGAASAFQGAQEAIGWNAGATEAPAPAAGPRESGGLMDRAGSALPKPPSTDEMATRATNAATSAATSGIPGAEAFQNAQAGLEQAEGMSKKAHFAYDANNFFKDLGAKLGLCEESTDSKMRAKANGLAEQYHLPDSMRVEEKGLKDRAGDAWDAFKGLF